VRTSTEVGAISQGSIFKIKVRDTGVQVQLREQSKKKVKANKPVLLQKRELVMDDYYKSFKVIVVNEERQHILLTLTDLTRYIRTFDVETEKRHSDFTNDALLKLLSKALRRLKRLCVNALPSTIQSSYPYEYPIKFIQQCMRETGCIDSVGALLLKLFPGGASIDFSEDEFMQKLLGQLLTLITISVKNNKRNKMYTFRRIMRIIQKYVRFGCRI
jgi:hypothetical protein